MLRIDNNKRYGPAATAQQAAMHRRSGSISQMEGLHSDPALQSLIRPLGTPNVVEFDVFPPVRSHAPDQNLFLPYIPEDIAFEDEYEDYLSHLGLSDEHSSVETSLFGKGGAGSNAWTQLPTFVSQMTEGISDNESVVSIGDLGDENRLDATRDEREVENENVNNWEVRHVFEARSILMYSCEAHEPEDDGSTAQVACSGTAREFWDGAAACAAVQPGRGR